MSLIKKIFGRDKALGVPVFAEVGIDFHSHLIPGIDDGASTMEDAISLIRQMLALGFRKLITTPHVQQESYRNTSGVIHHGLEKLREELQRLNIPIQLEAAAEYLLDDGFEQKMTNNELLTFSGGYILVELSYFNPHPNLHSFIFDLQIAGYKVILAHPERYSYWFHDLKKFEELKNREVFFQLNTVSLSNHYGKEVRKMAEKLIALDMIDFIGSDMHNDNYMHSLVAATSHKSLIKLIGSGRLLNKTL